MTGLRERMRRRMVRERISGGMILTRAVVRTIQHSGWFAYVLIVLVGAAGLWKQQQLTSDIQSSRLKSATEACEQRNDQAIVIADFVSSVTPELEPRVRREFRIQGDCREYARRAVEGEELPEPVQQPQKGGGP